MAIYISVDDLEGKFETLFCEWVHSEREFLPRYLSENVNNKINFKTFFNSTKSRSEDLKWTLSFYRSQYPKKLVELQKLARRWQLPCQSDLNQLIAIVDKMLASAGRKYLIIKVSIVAIGVVALAIILLFICLIGLAPEIFG